MNQQPMRKYLSQEHRTMVDGLSIEKRMVSIPYGLHWHNYIEVELITAGEGEQILNGQRQKMARGTVSVLRLTDYHQVLPIDGLQLINLSIDEQLLDEEEHSAIARMGAVPCFSLQEEAFAELVTISILCLTEVNKCAPNRRYLKALLKCFFLKLLEAADIKSGNPGTDRGEALPVRGALLYLHMHFREDPSLQTVAKLFHYNASYFSSVFHKEIGMTYSAYLNTLKIKYAKELLLCTDLKIQEVWMKCGFSSYGSFLKAFKEREGISAAQFRKKTCNSKGAAI